MILAAASEAVAVGARVVQAVTAASDRVLRNGVWVNTGVAVMGIYRAPKWVARKIAEAGDTGIVGPQFVVSARGSVVPAPEVRRR